MCILIQLKKKKKKENQVAPSSVFCESPKPEILTLQCTPNPGVSFSWPLSFQDTSNPSSSFYPHGSCVSQATPWFPLLPPAQPCPVTYSVCSSQREIPNTGGPRWNLVAPVLGTVEFPHSATLFSLFFHLKTQTGINKLWYIHTTEYYSATKRANKPRYELTSHDMTRRKFKCILQSERRNLKRLHTVRFQLYDILEKGKL